jgi:hypothetical protein
MLPCCVSALPILLVLLLQSYQHLLLAAQTRAKGDVQEECSCCDCPLLLTDAA